MPGPRDAATDHLVIVVVDDDPIFRNRLCRAFRDRACEAHEAATAEETYRLAANISPDLVLLDLKMPGLNGLDLVQNIKKLDSTIAKMHEKWFGVAPAAGSAAVTVFPGYGVPDMPGYDPTAHTPSCS